MKATFRAHTQTQTYTLHTKPMADRQQQRRGDDDCNCFCLYMWSNRRLFYRKEEMPTQPTFMHVYIPREIFNYASIEYCSVLRSCRVAETRGGSRFVPTYYFVPVISEIHIKRNGEQREEGNSTCSKHLIGKKRMFSNIFRRFFFLFLYFTSAATLL